MVAFDRIVAGGFRPVRMMEAVMDNINAQILVSGAAENNIAQTPRNVAMEVAALRMLPYGDRSYSTLEGARELVRGLNAIATDQFVSAKVQAAANDDLRMIMGELLLDSQDRYFPNLKSVVIGDNDLV